MDITRGLTSRQAADALARDGPNALPVTESRTILRVVADVLREPMFLLLTGCAAIYLLLGELADAWVLIAFVGVVLGITVVQERRTERALEALRDLSSPRALVIRDGVPTRIAGRDVAVGDLLVLNEGDRVAADGFIVETRSLSTDESLLTGESVPVRKVAVHGGEAPTASAPGGDDLPFVYSGSLVVAGRGLARVTATGPRTALGRIGKSLSSIDTGRTRLEADTDRLVRRVSIAAIGVCIVAALVYGATRGHWLDGMLAGIAIAMSLLPEEFPVVLTVFLALGAWRLSRHQVLTRRIPAIEALGAATVLCVDKTGTLTENRMRVAALVDANGDGWSMRNASPLPEMFHGVLEYARLATPDEAFDPMERAVVDAIEATLAGTEHIHRDWKLLREYPLAPELLSMSRAWRGADGGAAFSASKKAAVVVAAKGAPEAIVDLCHVDGIEADAIRLRVDALAADGFRVIGVAAARLASETLPDGQHDFDFRYVGLVALADPVRPGVAAAIDECRRAGIRVVMITGDLPRTASSIASTIGLPSSERVLTGPEIAGLDDAALAKRLADTHVIARAVPEQKLQIVRALQQQRHVVAMTGDGVNDAPALKAADIGIAMGRRGSDVAREAASLVVLDDDFGSIVRAVRMGRRIHANLTKAVGYIIAVHLPIAGVALVPIFLGWPVALLPAHIAFLELIIDPACSLAFEAENEDPDVMDRPPRDADRSLYSGLPVRFGLIEGAIVLAFALGADAIAFRVDATDAAIRTVAFSTLVLGNLMLIVAGRSYRRASVAHAGPRNRVVGWIVGGALFALSAVLCVPALRELFRLAAPTMDGMAIAIGAAAGTWVSLLALRWVVDRAGGAATGKRP